MKEKERLEIVKRIINDFENYKLLEIKKNELEDLNSMDIIRKYNILVSDIAVLEKSQVLFDGLQEKMIYYEFLWALNGYKKEKDRECNHDIWIYRNSQRNYVTDKDIYLIQCENENHLDFCHNIYVCLECEKCITVKDYKKFEEENIVLKNYQDKDIYKYREIYYQLLFANNANTAQEKVIEIFNDNKNKLKIKKKENGKYGSKN